LDKGIPSARTTGLFLQADQEVDSMEREKLDHEAKLAWEAFNKAFDAWYEAGMPAEDSEGKELKKAVDTAHADFYTKFNAYKALFQDKSEGQQTAASLDLTTMVASLLGTGTEPSLRKFRFIDGLSDIGQKFLASPTENMGKTLIAMFIKSMGESAMAVENFSDLSQERLATMPDVALEMTNTLVESTKDEYSKDGAVKEESELKGVLENIHQIKAARKDVVDYINSNNLSASFVGHTMKSWEEFMDNNDSAKIGNLVAELSEKKNGLGELGISASVQKGIDTLIFAAKERMRGEGLKAKLFKSPDSKESYWMLEGYDGSVLARVRINELSGNDLNKVIKFEAKTKEGKAIDKEIKAASYLTSPEYGLEIEAWVLVSFSWGGSGHVNDRQAFEYAP
jgi:hypothetical protein